MNKIFKHKRGASGLKVVCEFAKSHCSSGEKTAVSSGAHVSTRSGFKSLSIALISALTLGIATPAMAGQQFGIGASSSGGTDATAGGRGAKASGSGSTAIGSNTEASGVVSAALGSRSKAADGQSVAVGDRVVARGKEATAIGSDTVAADVSSIAIGSDNTTGYDNKQAFENVRVITSDDLKNNKELISALDKLCDSLKYNNNGNCSTTYGISKNNANGTYEISNIDTFYSFFPTLSDGVGSIAIGARTITANKGSTAIGSLSVAIGEKSSAFGLQSKASNVQSLALGAGSLSSGNQATAVGNDVAAIGKSSIAIGNDDLTNTANGTNDGYMNNVMVDLTELNNPNSEIRKVYDAAFDKNNVRLKDYGLIYENNQYRFVNADDVGKSVDGASDVVYESDKVGNQKKYSQSISSGIGSIVVGSRSLALGKGATTIGALARATGDESAALGSLSKAIANSAIAIGRGSVADIANSVALGVDSRTDYTGMHTKAYMPGNGYVMPMADSVGVVSVGSTNQPRRIVNLASGALDTDAVNVAQLKSLAENLGVDNLSDNADKSMRYLSVNRTYSVDNSGNPTGSEAGKLQFKIDKARDFKAYATLLKTRDLMTLNEKVTGIDYKAEDKKDVTDKISALENKYKDFANKITAVGQAKLNGISKTSTEAEVKAIKNEIDTYSTQNSNSFALSKEELKQFNATNEGATGADAIAIGYSAKTKENAANAIAIGKSSNATDINTIAIGNNAKANGKSSINIGEGVAADNVLGANSVLIGSAFGDIAKTNTSLKITSSTIAGTDLKIEGTKIDKSVIIGSRHEIGQETTATNALSQNVIVGEKIRLDNSEQAVTIGSDITAKNSKGGIAIGGDDADLVSGYPKTEIQGKGAIAIGVSAKAMKDAAMSLGVNSQTTVAQGVALGFNSVANTDKGAIGLEFDTATNTLKESSKSDRIWKSTAAALSIGSDTITRQITNVAAGSENTDAVNVAQLRSVSDAISFNVKGKDSAGTADTTNSIKSGKTVEFASADKYLKISHTAETNGNSKFTFDVDENELKKTIGATSTGDYSLEFSGDTASTKIIRDKTNKELKIKGGVTTTADLSTGNIGVEADATAGTLNIKLAKALTGLTSAEFAGGTAGGKTVINGDGVSYNKADNLESDGTVKDPNKTVSLGKDGINAGSKIISNVADGTGEKDAVNKKQAETIADNAVKKLTDSITDGTNVYFNAESDDAATGSKKVANTKDIKFKGDGNVKTSIEQEADGSKTTVKFTLNTKDLNLGGKDGTDGKIAVNGADGKSGVAINGKDGVIGAKGKDGKDGVVINGDEHTIIAKGADGKDGVTINGKDGTIGLAGTNGANGLTIRGGKGADGVDGANGADGITRIIYKDANNKDHEVATLDDGIKFVGNKGDKALKLNKQFTIQGSDDNKYTAGSTDKWDTFDAGANIMTKAEADGDNGKLTIALAKALKGLTSAEFAGGTAGGKTVINGDGVSYNKADNLESDGTVKDPNKTVSLGKDGINAGGKTISNVGEAQKDTDAVNMKQMNETIKKEIATNNASTELTFVGNDGETKAKDGKITIAGGQTDTKKLSDKPNIGVVAKDGELNIKLAKDIEVDSVTAKDKITVGEGANKITIADGKITGITSAVDPNGKLADKLKAIDNFAGKTAAEKAAEKKDAIQKALDSVVDNSNVATVGDLKNVTKGLDSVVNNVVTNVTNVTTNVNNITNVVTGGDSNIINKINNAKDAKKADSNYENVVKDNPLKTYNPYKTTVKNNTTIVDAIKNINERGIKFIHVSDGNEVGKDDDVALVSDDSRANKKGSIGIGMKATSTAENAIATGTESTASGLNSIATGTNSIATGTNSIAMGTDAKAMGENTISIGKGNKVIGENSGAIGDPTTMENVNGVYSMGNYNSIQGGGEKAKADKTARDIFAIGNNIGSDKKVTDKANGSVILGSNGYSNVTNGVALGYGSNASVEKGKVGYDITGTNHDKDTSGIWKSTESAVSVGNIDKKITRQITSVAAGTQDTDAVNVAQLKAVANQITAVTTNNGVTTSDQTFNPKTGRQVSYNPTYAPKVTNTGVNSVAIGANSVANRANTVSVGSAGNERIIANVADGVAPTDAANMRQLQSVANMVGEVKKDAMAGTASAMAIGNLPQATIPGKGMMAIGAGYYKGQTATALGVSKMSENGRWVFKASASYDSQRNVGAAGAIGFHF